MSLAFRLSAFFLAALGAVLVGFSAALYLGAWAYLRRQLDDRLDGSLAVLAAAAESHPDGVEWEPQERELALGQDAGPDRLRWMVHDGAGRLVDRSRNLAAANLTPEWTPRPGDGGLPARLADRQGRAWRSSRRRLLPGPAVVLRDGHPPDHDPPGVRYPALVLTVCAPVEPVEGTLAALAWALLILSPGVWGVAAFLGRRFCRKALAPLTRMVTSARGLDATDPGWSLPEAGTGDELDELGRTFNDLLGRLSAAYERQRRFSGDASHQLRTPLTILIGQLDVALRRDRPAEEYRRVIRVAHGRAVQLRRIVEALLSLSHPEADAGRPGGETLDLARWVAGHMEDRRDPARAADAVRGGADGGPLWVRAHPPLLGQLLDNLLDNAGKYSPPGAPVVVRTWAEPGFAALAVEDAGMGIAAEDLPRVFEPFFRSAEARRLGKPGVGLGLALVRRIATASGGTVEVQSEAGRGSRFTLRLPAAPHPPPGRAGGVAAGVGELIGSSTAGA